MGKLKAGLYDRARDQERVLHTTASLVEVHAIPEAERIAVHYTPVMLDNNKACWMWHDMFPRRSSLIQELPR